MARSGRFAPLIFPQLLLPQLLRMQPRITTVLATPRTTQKPIPPALELATALNALELGRWRTRVR